MPNTKLIFYGTEESGSDSHELICFINHREQIYISLDMGDYPVYICLDKPTAIKFAKTLRTEINKIGKEASNG
jgi:hypothetical protein